MSTDFGGNSAIGRYSCFFSMIEIYYFSFIIFGFYFCFRWGSNKRTLMFSIPVPQSSAFSSIIAKLGFINWATLFLS